MVVGEASIHNIMGGMESTGGVRLHNHKRKLKQRFDIIKKLGQGTYGKVQLGINKKTGQEVAIKTIKKCKIETEADLIRIRREIQIMSSVQHPNIIHIYEVFENREKMVLVMEYAAGGELYDYLSERKVLSEQEARRIFRQIATAVFYCHKHKICHRDLKLENILLDQTGNAKIADFGLSNVFDEQRLLSTFCGSPLYASPEIVKGTPYHGPEVDCWSLGVLLYTLVYGAMPFDGSNFKRLVKQISQSDYFEPKQPSPASPLIKDMLTVCPTRRADIEKICTHWWVNEGYEQNCLDIAEDLAAQTPVRLDLLLSLVPQSASAEKLLVGDQQAANDVANSMSSETLVPTRCHSVGSLMELDQNNSDRRIRELLEEEPRAAASGDAKRKLETTPSMDETAAAGVKRKERSRRKERTDEREPRTYRSASRHHSAPIPNSITEEAMEVDPTVSVPTTKTVDSSQLEAAAACLELIEECKEKSPSKERSKTPVSKEQMSKDTSMENVEGNHIEEKKQAEETKLIDETSPKDTQQNETLSNETTDTQQLELDTRGSEVPNKEVTNNREKSLSQDIRSTEFEEKEIKRLKEKALSLDSELSNEPAEPPSKPVERRRSKIFETAEKFNQMASGAEPDKPKKIFIPGVNVGGAKRVFERKASLSGSTVPPTAKASASKVIIDVPVDKKNEKVDKLKSQEATEAEEKLKREEAKKRAVDIITGAIGKPPVQRKVNGSPPVSPLNQDASKLGLKIQVGPNDVRNATVSVSTPVETKFPFDKSQDSTVSSLSEVSSIDDSHSNEPKMSSKMEITLKSATLPRPRKTSKAEITLSGIKSAEPAAFKSEVEAKIDAFQPQKLRTQRSEVAFPVAAAVPHVGRSSSLEPETRSKSSPKERIIPIQVEAGHQHAQHSSTPPPKPPMPQRSMSQRSSSLSRQSTADSDTDSALGSTVGPEPIRKSPREYIIPIAVEGGGYVTPRSGSVEPESKTSTPTSTNPPRPRFGRPRRMSSLLSDASEDESPFSTLHRDSEDLLQRHMHRLRSSRPSRQPPEHADSLSSGEDDDDDGFELLTAENLFSTLLSRVRSLTQRLNVDDNRSTGFPSTRLLGRLGSNSPQTFWGLNKPLSRRMSESQFKHSLSRDTDLFSRKDSASSSNAGTPNSPGHNTPSRESVFEIGSNTLPRDKVEHEDVEAEAQQIRKEAQESLEQNFTPSLARRLSRQFIEQTRQSLPRSPSIPRDRQYRSPTRDVSTFAEVFEDVQKRIAATTSDRSEYRDRSIERNIRRTNSLLETGSKDKTDYRSPRRSISLFNDDDDCALPPLPRQSMTLGRRFKDPVKNIARRETFYRTEKIQEEPGDELRIHKENLDNGDNLDTASTSECTSLSLCNSNTNIIDGASSVSAKSYETSSTESTSNVDCNKSMYKNQASKNFESRLLAAENLIKESKLKNLSPKFNPNLNSNYKDTDKCDKEVLSSIADTSAITKRRSCIPSLRLRSGSLTREAPSTSVDRRKSFSGSQDALASTRALTPERSILSKLFRAGSKEAEPKEKTQKPKQRRISRFLRPDFFDTPREESKYVKEKEAQKAAENERRKSRFMKRKETKLTQADGIESKTEKELKNGVNSNLKNDQSETSSITTTSDDKSKSEDSRENSKLKFERQNSKSGFLQSLEKKLEKFRSSDESPKTISNGGVSIERKARNVREKSAPPAECLSSELNVIKRAISVEDVPSKSPNVAAKSKVSSVLGLFKHNDSKQTVNNSRSQGSTILSKLKRSPTKSTKSETSPNEDAPSTSKIPMKFIRNDSKTARKSVDNKKSPEKVTTESKKSPPKEKVKERENNIKDRKPSNEKLSKDTKRTVLSDSNLGETSNGKDRLKKVESPPRIESSKRASEEIDLSQKTIDNKQVDAKNEEKKLMKTKKNISSLSKSNSITKPEKVEESEKKIKKIVKAKTGTENKEENGEGVKKKKIVRVVKKTAKKSSDTSDSKSEEKPSKTIKKVASSAKNETSPESINIINKTNKEDISVIKTSASDGPPAKSIAPENIQDASLKLYTDSKICDPKSNENNEYIPASTSNTSSKPTETRANRANLKLDLSKIPQHTFRNSTPKKDSPKAEVTKPNTNNASLGSPKVEEVNAEKSSEKLDALSKMTYHANITGNKIVIDKPLKAKDVAELKKEVTECARIIENRIETHMLPKEEVQPIETSQGKDAYLEKEETRPQREESLLKRDEISTQIAIQKEDIVPKKIISPKMEVHSSKEETIDSNKRLEENLQRSSSKTFEERKEAEAHSEYASELLSPVEEPESFDSWSICSADMNHTRGDLHSPTSPTSYSLYLRGDQPESVIDRIRRRSFYSRFNDRKRASLTAPPPGVTLPSGTSLSRKYSFNSLKDRDRSKLTSYRSPCRRDRSYSVYSDDILSHARPTKERYTDVLSTSPCGDAKSPSEHYSSTSSYDPLRRYLRSPTFEASGSRRRYHSTDFGGDSEFTSYRSPLSGSLLNDSFMQSPHAVRTCGTLPRKFGSSVGSMEPKTVEYYEELLAPTNPDFLIRKSPLSVDQNRCENGYSNGSLDLPHYNTDARRSYDRTPAESHDNEHRDRRRCTSQRISETRDLPASSDRTNPCTAE